MSPRSDWRAVALRRAHARAVAVREKQGYIDMARIQMVVGGFFAGRLAQAAERRGMSVTAYCRRAVAAFVAADLDEPLVELLADIPHPGGPHHGSYDDGTGYGTWQATPFVDDTGVIQGS